MDYSNWRRSTQVEDAREPDDTPNRYNETVGSKLGDVYRQVESNTLNTLSDLGGRGDDGSTAAERVGGDSSGYAKGGPVRKQHLAKGGPVKPRRPQKMAKGGPVRLEDGGDPQDAPPDLPPQATQDQIDRWGTPALPPQATQEQIDRWGRSAPPPLTQEQLDNWPALQTAKSAAPDYVSNPSNYVKGQYDPNAAGNTDNEDMRNRLMQQNTPRKVGSNVSTYLPDTPANNATFAGYVGGAPAHQKGAINTGPPASTKEALNNAVDAIDAAMDHGRAKYGLPTSAQQGAIPTVRPVAPLQAQAQPPVQTAAAAAPAPFKALPIPTGPGRTLPQQDQNIYNPDTNTGPPQMQYQPPGPRQAAAPPQQGAIPGVRPFQSLGKIQHAARGGPILPVALEGGADPVDAPPAPMPAIDIEGTSPADQQAGSELVSRLAPPPQEDTPAPATPAIPTDQATAGPPPAGTQGGIGSDRNSSQQAVHAYLSRQDKISNDTWKTAYTAAEEQHPTATPAQLNQLTVASMPNQDLQFGAKQRLAAESDHQAHLNRVEATGSKPDFDKLATGFEQQLSHNTTGENVTVTNVGDGLLKFTVKGGAGSASGTATLNINQLHDLSNIGKAGQYDTMDENGVLHTLKTLEATAGTAPPVAPKPDLDKPANDGTLAGRNTPSELASARRTHPTANDPWKPGDGLRSLKNGGQDAIQQQQAELERLRQQRLEPEQKLAQAAAGQDAKKEVAAAGNATKVAVEQLKQDNENHRAIAKLSAAGLQGKDALVVKQAGQYLSAMKPLPPDLQTNLNELNSRIANGVSAGAAQEDTSTGPGAQSVGQAPGRGQAPAAAPTRGLNADGGAAYGKRKVPQATGWTKPQQAPQ
jgi:hypothetical protein